MSRVLVPFGNRSVVGFILTIDEEGTTEGLKAVGDLLDPVPLIDGACYRLCDWASRYYVAPIGLVLKYALSSSINLEKYCLVKARDGSLAHLDNLPLKKAYNVAGKETVLGYLSASLIGLCDVFNGEPIGQETSEGRISGYRATLYQGGAEDRREYYVSLIRRQLEQHRSVLMLLPDREAVGEFFYRTLLKAFPGSVFWFSGSASAKKKAEVYFRARTEKGRLLLGSKSCVFLPLMDSGLIIVERPEEDEYRNEEAFKFNAMRLAVKRAEIEGIPVVLGSVSPPMEVMKWAEDGAIEIEEGRPAARPPVSYARGDTDRGGDARLPEVLVNLIGEATTHGGNVVIHTPRRSYATGLYCSACGRPVHCMKCRGAALSYSREGDTLSCNTCKSVFPYMEKCPSCSSDLIRFFDVGAEYIRTRLEEAFTGRTVFRITGEAGTRQNLKLLRKGEAGEGNIIVGTHVLSKLYGLRTARLILFGWEDFSRIAGYRAREKMFQVYMNLLDALRPEELLVYTHGKEAFDVSSFLDTRRFYEDELEMRKIAEFPPYVRLFLLNVLKRNERAGEKTLAAIEELVAKEHLDHQMLGPIESKGRYGWRIVLKGEEEAFSAILTSLYRLPGVHIDADPLYL